MDFRSEHLVPRNDLELWYECRASGTAGNDDNTAYDLSGNGRHADGSSGTGSPVIQTGLAGINSEAAWYFDGSADDPLATASDSFSVKHLFAVLAFDLATFTTHNGVLSGLTTGNLLTSNNTGTNFYEFGAYEFRNANVLKVNGASAWSAPMSGGFRVIEVKYPSLVGVDGVRVGQQLADTARKAKMWFAGCLLFSSDRTEAQRASIYRYYANRYHLWEKTAAGLNIFPYVGGWTSKVVSKKRVLYDEAMDGSSTYRLKRSKKRYFDLEFVRRTPDELKAADAFYDEHYPGTDFIYRDKRFYPADEVQVKFAKDAEVPSESAHHTSFGYQLPVDEV